MDFKNKNFYLNFLQCDNDKVLNVIDKDSN